MGQAQPCCSSCVAAADTHPLLLLQVAPAQPPKLAADTEIGTKPEDADEEVGGPQAKRRQTQTCPPPPRAPGWLHPPITCTPAGSGFSDRVPCLLHCTARMYHLHAQELLASMAPKKANWDLKREIEPRLAKLERRTQRALVEIMLEEEQQRLQQEGGVAD